MIKLQDFARECGVTDRAIQKHLKTYAEELEGLYQRKGPNGTWLTDAACEILRSKMKQAPMAVTDSKTLREKERLEQRVRELEERLEKKEALLEMAQRRADELQEKAGQVRALEAGKKAAEQEIKLLEGFVDDAKAEIQAVRSEKDEEARRATEAEKNAQNANLRLSEATETFAKEKSLLVQENDQLRADLDAVKKMKPWQRLFWKGK